MIISIAIADQNREYVERLSEALRQYNDLNISVFTNEERLKSALEREKFDILLFDPDISQNRIMVSGVKLAICLYSDEANNSQMYADVVPVLKYQRISNIYKEILKQYSEKAGYSAEFNYSQQTKLISVFSPIGGCGKTTLAMAVAMQYAESGYHTLFVSAEQLSSSSFLFEYKEEGNTALIEAIDGDAVFELKLKGVAKAGVNGVSYVEGFERYVDYSDVSQAEMKKLLANIRKCGIFDRVVIDMESHVDGIANAIFEESDHIIIVNKPGELPARKIMMFSEQGLIMEIKNKCYIIENFAEPSSVYGKSLTAPVIGKVQNFGNLAVNNMIHTVLSSKQIDLSRLN